MLRAIREVLRRETRPKTVFGINARNRRLIYPWNERRDYPLADDKLRTKEILSKAGVPVPLTLCVFSDMLEARRAPAILRGVADFVIKPAKGGAGNGILVLVKPSPPGWLDHSGRLWTPQGISRHVSDIIFGNYTHGLSDRAIVEDRLVQAPLFGDVLFPGLPDIRILTLGAEAIMAMLRVPTNRSGGRANLHQGAVGVGIDLATGKATHATFRGAPIEEHPDTGTPLVGPEIPGWSEMVAVAERAARALPLGYLGIDLAIHRSRGPLVLEVNVRPGLEIQNANNQGLGEVIDPAGGTVSLC